MKLAWPRARVPSSTADSFYCQKEALVAEAFFMCVAVHGAYQ